MQRVKGHNNFSVFRVIHSSVQLTCETEIYVFGSDLERDQTFIS